MRWFVEALERRDDSRMRQQLSCKLLVDGRCLRGVVKNFSARGLFVQTRKQLRPGADVIVAFSEPEGLRFVLEASAPHWNPVSLSLSRLVSAGVGLRIQDPPTAYLQWVEGASPDAP
jgi:Tfp pilus assembly protein PilZ